MHLERRTATWTELRLLLLRGLAVLASCALVVSSACGGESITVLSECSAASCDDGNPCTSDECTITGQCSHGIRAAELCNDGKRCVYGGECEDGVCVGKVKNCDDGIACTTDKCGASDCVNVASDSTVCDDNNPCTGDSCDVKAGCKHAPVAGGCSDGNLCTQGDVCEAGLCLPGALSVTCDDKNPCTTDTCNITNGQCVFANNSLPCDDGNACTLTDSCGNGKCRAGTMDCVCAKNSGVILPPQEDCDTPIDDDCNGKINEASACGPILYKFSNVPGCGAVCYYDEAHNIAINGPGQGAMSAGFDTYAAGQLMDGVRGADDWFSDLGLGTSFEWVAWASLQPFSITFKFPGLRNLTVVRLGVNNRKDGSVSQPPEVQLRVSMDGTTWSKAQTFKVGDGTLKALPDGKRGDITLPLPVQTGVYLEMTFVTAGSWTFVDEIEFD